MGIRVRYLDDDSRNRGVEKRMASAQTLKRYKVTYASGQERVKQLSEDDAKKWRDLYKLKVEEVKQPATATASSDEDDVKQRARAQDKQQTTRTTKSA